MRISRRARPLHNRQRRCNQPRGSRRQRPGVTVVVTVKLPSAVSSGFSASRTRTAPFADCGSLGVFQVKTPVSGSIAAFSGPAKSSYLTGRARCRSTAQAPSPWKHGDLVRVVHALLLAHAEDRHDIGVMQPCRRAGLEPEPIQVGRARQAVLGQDLQGHVAAQRLLHGLVDHAHPSPADLTDRQALAEQPVLSPAYAVSGAVPGRSSGGLSTAGKTLQAVWYVASREQFT